MCALFSLAVFGLDGFENVVFMTAGYDSKLERSRGFYLTSFDFVVAFVGIKIIKFVEVFVAFPIFCSFLNIG